MLRSGTCPSAVESSTARLPKPVTFKIGDASDRLSIAHAMQEGYKITLADDGCAAIQKADGTAYHIVDFECDCPDALGRNGGSYEAHGQRFCKHVLWLRQVYPCRYCGSMMALIEHTTCFGDTFRTFDCPNSGCNASVDFRFVQRSRQIKRAMARQREEEVRKEAEHVSV